MNNHVSAMVDKGKEKEKEQVGEGSKGADEGAVDTASAGMVEDNADPDPADRLSKPAPVMTVTIPTPIRPIPTCLRPS